LLVVDQLRLVVLSIRGLTLSPHPWLLLLLLLLLLVSPMHMSCGMPRCCSSLHGAHWCLRLVRHGSCGHASGLLCSLLLEGPCLLQPHLLLLLLLLKQQLLLRVFLNCNI
jgi:hypothetical protein